MANPARVREVFYGALEVAADAREAFLREACAGDEALRREIDQLLGLQREVGGFLEQGPAPREETDLAGGAHVGPYRVLRRLGGGGMGIVYRARHHASGREVALKVVRLPDPRLLESFRREVHLLGRLRHPGIVPVVDQGVHEQLPWYAMELVEGLTLDRHAAAEAQRCGPGLADRLPSVLGLARRLCAPLSYLHGEGMVHRDLKPGNVVVRGDGRPVLVDFGLIGRFAGAVSREVLALAEAAGTARYMAPEQARGELPDARADLYSLGCILFELIAGRAPFEGETRTGILDRRAREDPPAPSRFVAGVPPELDALVLGLLAREPRDRIGHADDVAVVLEGLGAGNGVEGPPPRTYLYPAGLAGRDEPLQALTARLAGLRDGHGGVVLLAGESGVGKTRLAMDLASRARRLDLHVVTEECPQRMGAAGAPAGAALPLQPFRNLLRAIADRCRQAPAEARRLLGPGGFILGLYEPLLDGPWERPAASLAEGKSPAAVRKLIAASLQHLLGRLAEERPVLLLIDDVHWADDLALAVLELLADASWEGAAVLVVATYREEAATPPLERMRERAGRLHLGRLDEASLRAMVSDMLAVRVPPEELVRLVLRHSEGNPFVAGEYLRLAAAEGLLRRSAGRWLVASDDAVRRASLPIPESVRDVTAWRLDGLPAEPRGLLEQAAVLGREVPGALLERLAGMEEDRWLSSIEELCARHVLEDTGQASYRFTHDALREVAYARLPAERRVALHRAAAEGLASSAPPAELGHHWEQAGARARAAASFLEAASQDEAAYAHEDAERHYRRYLALVAEPSAERSHARWRLATNVLAWQGRKREAVEEYERASEDARAAGAAREEAAALAALGRTHHWLGAFELGHTLSKEALRLARASGARGIEADIIRDLAIQRRGRGDVEGARELYREALAIYREQGHRRAEAGILVNMAVIHHYEGSADEARTLTERALVIAREVGSVVLQGQVLVNLSNVLDDPAAKEAALVEALAIARAVGDRPLEGQIVHNLAVARQNAGAEGTRALFEQALRIHRDVGNVEFEAKALADLGELHLVFGEPDLAAARLEESLALARRIGTPQLEVDALVRLAGKELHVEDTAHARRHIDRALELVADVDDPQIKGHLALLLGMAEQMEGSIAPAAQRYETALASARGSGDLLMEADALLLLARLARFRAPSLEAARALLSEARSILDRIPEPRALDRLVIEEAHLALAEGRAAGPVLEPLRASARRRVVRGLPELERAVEAFEAGRPLIRGSCPGDVPKELP